MKSCSFLLHLVVFGLSELGRGGNGDPGWIRICSKDQGNLDLSSEDCSKGVWLKDPFVLDCLCVYGVWMINRGYCDKLGSLILGTGQCFSFKEKWRQIRSIQYLGEPSDAFQSNIFLGSKTLDSFERVSRTGFSSSESSPAALLFINTPEYVQGSSNACLRSGTRFPATLKFPVQDTRFRVSDRRNCSKARGSGLSYDLNFNQYYENHRIHNSDSLCTQTCLQNRKPRQVRTNPATSKPISLKQTTTSPVSASSAAPRSSPLFRPAGRSIRRPAPVTLTPCLNISSPPMNETDDYVPPPLPKVQIREIQEQTMRLFQGHLSRLFRGGTQLRANITEFQYLEYSRKILLRACPLAHSHFVINGLFAMFGTVLAEALQFYPHSEDEDKSRISAILDGLRTCLNGSGPAVTLNYDPCGSGKVAFANLQLVNGSQLNIIPDLPLPLQFNLKNYDMVVETVWKMFTFTSYHCARVFQSNPFFHSKYIVQVEEFFKNRRVLMRWLNPGDSLKVNRLLFYNFDLERIANEVDSCVAVAKASSKYPVWIQRKKRYLVVQRRKRRSIGETDVLWEGRGYCLRDHRDPVHKFGYQKPRSCNND